MPWKIPKDAFDGTGTRTISKEEAREEGAPPLVLGEEDPEQGQMLGPVEGPKQPEEGD